MIFFIQKVYNVKTRSKLDQKIPFFCIILNTYITPAMSCLRTFCRTVYLYVHIHTYIPTCRYLRKTHTCIHRNTETDIDDYKSPTHVFSLSEKTAYIPRRKTTTTTTVLVYIHTCNVCKEKHIRKRIYSSWTNLKKEKEREKKARPICIN